MKQDINYGMGRLFAPDDRDKNFSIKKLLAPEPPKIDHKYWGANAWWGDQGQSPMCFPAGTFVTMMDGSEKPIEKINAGEFVITHAGRPRMVSAVMARRHEGEVTATYVRGSHYPLISTPDHKYYVTSFEGEQKTDWKEAKDLTIKLRNKSGDYLNLSTARPIETETIVDVEELLQGKLQSNKEKAILKGCKIGAISKTFEANYEFGKALGLYLAEGYSRNRTSQLISNEGLHLAFGSHTEEEIQLSNETAILYKNLFDADVINRKRPSNCMLVSVHSSTLSVLMKALAGHYAHEKHLHPCIWMWPDEALKGIWDGFSLGDGYKRNRDDRPATEEILTTVSEQLARDLWRIGNRLGYAPSLKIIPPNREKRKRQVYRVVAYHGTRTSWKPKGENVIYCAVQKQERLPFEGLVYDLTVEEDHSFLANGYIVHNCVGYAWAAWIEDGPVNHTGNAPILPPDKIYNGAQNNDEWPGDNYDGTSVRGGAKYLQSINAIESYHWGFTLDDLVNAVLTLGPVVVGTNWYDGMFDPINDNGLIEISGNIAGGHCYKIDGVSLKYKMLRIKNSWGRDWAANGFAHISFSDMERLIKEDGEVCIAIENEKIVLNV